MRSAWATERLRFLSRPRAGRQEQKCCLAERAIARSASESSTRLATSALELASATKTLESIGQPVLVGLS